MTLTIKMKNLKLIIYSLQHVLAMYGGAVIVPLIVGSALKLNEAQLTSLVMADLLTCGIATLLQVCKNPFFGIRLPVVLGCTFTAVSPMIIIGQTYGIPNIYGAIICAGIFVLLIANFFSKLLRFFPPVVTGSIVTTIGVTLIPVAMNNMAGGQNSPAFGSLTNLGLAFGVLAIILIIHRYCTGFIRAIAILLGMLIGTLVAFLIGKVNLHPVVQAPWFHLTKPFYFGLPTFAWDPAITMILVAIVSLVESTGVFLALSKICERELSEKDFIKGYRAEGIASILGGIFNSFPYTTFSQNVGLVQLSKIRTLNVIILAGILLITLGFLPKFATFATLIPPAVLGGAMVAMFGMVMASGIKMLGTIDFNKNENLLIIACSVGLGLGIATVPNFFAALPAGLRILAGNGIVAGSITAIGLNVFFNYRKK